MEFTFEVDGRKVTLSYDELEAIVREKFTQDAVESCSTPTEGKAFAINPMAIDRGLFSQKREDRDQEKTRQLILEAFAEVDANKEKYAKPFKTFMPKKTWSFKSAKELEKLANSLGGHLANWVEQALEWAQRIANGEKWRDLCNRRDTTYYNRLVKWKGDLFRFSGGSRLSFGYVAYPTQVSDTVYLPNDNLVHTVPLVVLR